MQENIHKKFNMAENLRFQVYKTGIDELMLLSDMDIFNTFCRFPSYEMLRFRACNVVYVLRKDFMQNVLKIDVFRK